MTEIVKGLNDIRNFFDKKVKSDMDDAIYAAQEALNAAAIGSSKIAGGVRGAKQTLVDEFEKTFDIKSKSFIRYLRRGGLNKGGIQIQKASKRDGLDMKIGINVNENQNWLKLQAFGLAKTPEDQKKGKNYPMLAIPTSRGAVKINSSGRITGAGAARMLKYGSQHPKKRKNHVATPHAFIMKGVAGGKDVIAKRNKENRKKIDFFFVLQPSIKIKKNWDFYGIIQNYIDKNLDSIFDRTWAWVKSHPKKR